ncbi:MAG TPA: VOC family protein, partial [Candidatus Marinimicrobia bacterium]|nr:VOC family protein [Candidatus Neomarinimicrobiota bacterium]
MKPKLQNIDHIHVFVSDRGDALDWYSNILGLKPLEEIIVLPESGPLMIRNNEGNINIALF